MACVPKGKPLTLLKGAAGQVDGFKRGAPAVGATPGQLPRAGAATQAAAAAARPADTATAAAAATCAAAASQGGGFCGCRLWQEEVEEAGAREHQVACPPLAAGAVPPLHAALPAGLAGAERLVQCRQDDKRGRAPTFEGISKGCIWHCLSHSHVPAPHHACAPPACLCSSLSTTPPTSGSLRCPAARSRFGPPPRAAAQTARPRCSRCEQSRPGGGSEADAMRSMGTWMCARQHKGGLNTVAAGGRRAKQVGCPQRKRGTSISRLRPAPPRRFTRARCWRPSG